MNRPDIASLNQFYNLWSGHLARKAIKSRDFVERASCPQSHQEQRFCGAGILPTNPSRAEILWSGHLAHKFIDSGQDARSTQDIRYY